MRAQQMLIARSDTSLLGKNWLSGALLSLALGLYGMVAAAAFVDPLDLPAAKMVAVHTKPLRAVVQVAARLVAVGESGLIIYSDDKGATWAQASVPVSTDLNALHFANERLGWAVGHGGAILHTQDGGATWVKQLDGRDLVDRIGEYYNEGRSGLAPDREQVYLDAIMSMTRPGPGQFFMGVWFDTKGEQGYAVGPFGLFMATKDGGKHWYPSNTEIDNDDLLHLTSIDEVGGTLVITGEQGHVWARDATTNRFIARATGYIGTLFGVTGTEHTMLAYGLRGHVFRSTNAGMNWEAVISDLDSGVVAGATLDDGSMLLISQNAEIVQVDAMGKHLTAVPAASSSVFTGVVGITSQQFALVGLNGFTTQSIR